MTIKCILFAWQMKITVKSLFLWALALKMSLKKGSNSLYYHMTSFFDRAKDTFSYHQGRKDEVLWKVLKCRIIPHSFISQKWLLYQVISFFTFSLYPIIVVHMVWQKCFSFSTQKRFKGEKCFSTIQWKSCECECVCVKVRVRKKECEFMCVCV